MASLAPEDKIEFLIQLLATGEFAPDYDALAKTMGINNKSNAQRRLKAIVEADKRFILQSLGSATSVIESGNSGTPKGTADSGKKAPAKRGRKRTKPADPAEENEESPSKAPREGPVINIEDDDVDTGDVDNGAAEQDYKNEDVV